MIEGLKEVDVPQQQIHNGIKFPLGLAPEKEDITFDNAIKIFQDNKDKFAELLLKHSAIALRGFPVNTVQQYEQLLLATGWVFAKYIGGNAPRVQITENIATSTEVPSFLRIPMHHEMAYTPKGPHKLALWCDVSAPADGETPLCLSNLIYQKMVQEKKDFVDSVIPKGIRYHKFFYDQNNKQPYIGQKSWQESFQTTDRAVAEKENEKQNCTVRWLEDGSLERTTQVFPIIRHHPVTNQPMWHCNLHLSQPGVWGITMEQAQFLNSYGDGSAVDLEDAKYIDKIMWENAMLHKWQKGDVVVVDNNAVLHGRNHFTPPRRVLVALSD